MNYYNLRSIMASAKKTFEMREMSASFSMAGTSTTPYIEPTFQKILFETEKPTIILVSAVGVSGKSALAAQISRDVKLPLLDLGKHKPVGDNTLTGLLTQSFQVKDISDVLEGLACGSYGVIIDGVDEGRSKTTEKAFEAFLDDIVRLCKGSSNTVFMMLGRTQILEDCWLYLSNVGIKTALITISPFLVDDAKKYIDAFTGGEESSYAPQYLEARDFIIEKLGKAFAPSIKEITNEFLSFMGYPPVLDAIVTLLKEEKNYHKLLEKIRGSDSADVEISLLHRIADYVLQRERELKVIPNIVEPLMAGTPDNLLRPALNEAYSVEEQCARLIAHCLGKTLTLSSIPEPKLNERYEQQLLTFLPEHPFVKGREFRNAVFEAVALATLMTSRNNDTERLVQEYVSSHKHSYHLVYMLDTMSSDHRITPTNLNVLFSAAVEFRSVHTVVELRVDGPDWDQDVPDSELSGDIEIEIEIILGEKAESSKTFCFSAAITESTCLFMGPGIGGAFVDVPCSITFGGSHELEMTAPMDVRAKSIMLEASSLILRPGSRRGTGEGVIIESGRLESRLDTIITNGVPFVLAVADTSGITYPAIDYALRTEQPPEDPLLRQKYFRLRRILVEFRSHSRGALARYRHKIEQERVLRNDIGQGVLNRLLSDRILTLDGSHYYLDPKALHNHLGVTWHDLRQWHMPERLITYLRTIP